jgi:hypothetical protein
VDAIDNSTSQNRKAHGETLKELGELKTLVRRVPSIRWIDWAILIGTFVSAIASVIGYWAQIVAAFRAFLNVF